MSLLEEKNEVVQETEVNTEVQNDVVDVKLDAAKKRKFRINGDNTKILELDVTDLGIVNRLKSLYPKMKKVEDEVKNILSSIDEADIDSEDTEKVLEKYSDALSACDKKMRDMVDEIFDANVAEVCAGGSTMYKLHGGKFMYEHIIETISKLYEIGLSEEFNRVRDRVKVKTAKYTGNK